MKFSLKTIAAAVVLAAASAGASAAIDNGALDGKGELFFSAWDGATSYNYDLNISIIGFEASFAALGNLNFTAGSDFNSSFDAWKSTANTSKLKWNILATDNAGARRIISTVGTGVVLEQFNKTNDVIRTAALNITTTINAINDTLVGNSGVTTSPFAASYAGTMGSFYPKFGFNPSGNLAANSYANGLVVQRTNGLATGILKSTNTAYVDNGSAVRSWIASDNTLHIAAVTAVPEPESYAMFLAGLGMLGFMARRRNLRG